MKIHLSKYRNLIVLALISTFGILIYSNALFVPFQADDETQIFLNPVIRNLNIHAIWQFNERRFLPYLSLAVNYSLTGHNVYFYHLFNILIHILTSFLVYCLMTRLFEIERLKEGLAESRMVIIALGAGLIFLSHPIQTQAVTYIIQRITSLCVFFYVAGLYCYASARIKNNMKWHFLGVLCFSAALVSKQIAYTFPIILILYEICFSNEPQKNLKKSFISVIPYFGVLLLYYFLVYHPTVSGGSLADITRANTDITRTHYFLSQFNVLRTYLSLILFPVGQNYAHDFQVIRDFFELTPLISCLLLIVILLTGYKCFNRYRLISFGIFWFFITLSIESTIFPIRDLGAEHRLYLPMVGISIILVSTLHYFFSARNLLTISLIALTGILGLLTHARNNVWRSGISLWEDVIAKSPYSSEGYANLGIAYGKSGNNQRAIHFLQKSLQMDPENANAYVFMGRAFFNLGNVEKAEEYLRVALQIDPKNAVAQYNLNLVQKKQTRST